MPSVIWTPKAHEYARLLLLMADAKGLEVTYVYLDGEPFVIESLGGKMPVRFRALFRKYIHGIARILGARGSVRYEKLGGEWARAVVSGSFNRGKRMEESLFPIPNIEDINMPIASPVDAAHE